MNARQQVWLEGLRRGGAPEATAALAAFDAAFPNQPPDPPAPEQDEPCACPVCGKVPEVRNNGFGWDVTCKHQDTPCANFIGTSFLSYRETRAEAVAAWNVMKK